MWIDPSDSSTVFTNQDGTGAITDGGLVRRINDKASPGTNTLILENGSNIGPVYHTTNMFPSGLAGLLCGQQESTLINVLLKTTNVDLGVTTNGAITVFIVGGTAPNTGGDTAPTIFGWSADAMHGVNFRRSNFATPMEAYTAPSFPFVTGTAVTNYLSYTWVVEFNAASDYFTFWTGYTREPQAVTTDPLPIQTHVCLGGFPLIVNNRWYGTIGEMIIYPRSLSGLEITNVLNYLIPKWGTRSGI